MRSFARERVEALFNRGELDRVAEFVTEVHEVLADGDMVAYRATLSGTHAGPLLGIPATGRPFRAQHMHMLRMRDGKASEHWASRDDLGMLQQLGVLPAPGAPG